MNIAQALVMAALQGATELFPVSSLGHAVLIPALLHWRLDEHAATFLPFLVMLHAGTALALLLYFWKDWRALVRGMAASSQSHEGREARRVVMLIGVATMPLAVVGFFLEKPLRILFGSPSVAAVFLAVNGLLLLAVEHLRGGPAPKSVNTDSVNPDESISSLSVKDAFVIGCWQCLALIPGISRSGVTIVGALLRRSGHARAAHFSFLIAFPAIMGATLLEAPHLFHHHAGESNMLAVSLLAALVAGGVAYLSTAFLMRWFRRHEVWALDPFAWYCIVAGFGGGALLCL